MLPTISTAGVNFKVWAPYAEHLTLRIYEGISKGDHVMSRDAHGVYQCQLKGCEHGTTYHYAINDRTLPDPASAYQPSGVHGPSMVVNFNQVDWSSDTGWRGVARENLVFYELHIGTFTDDGTYLGAIDRLDDLVDLGVTAVQLMPLAQCPGKWDWGYDGVQLYAPNHNYGSPEELGALVQACHARGLAIYNDVVYNHLGPEGNYLGQFGPYFQPAATAWGDCPDMSQSQVRAFFIENACYWIEQYHFDGLRFDAIAAIRDTSETHIMNEIGARFTELSARLGREVLAIGESNLYQPEFLPEHGGSMHALWSDDLGHAAEATLTPINTHGGRHYAGAADLMKALKNGCLYRRTESGGTERRANDAPPVIVERCVNQLQNHDMVGNSPNGRRIHQYASKEAQRALAALVLLYPTIPMIFMGEEFAADSPFPFFADFDSPELRAAVERGRERGFPHHSWENSISPNSTEAFAHSRLPKSKNGDPTTLRWYKDLLQERTRWRDLGLLKSKYLEVSGSADEGIFILNYQQGDNAHYVVAHVGEGSKTIHLDGPLKLHHQSGQVLLDNCILNIDTKSCAVGLGRAMLRTD